MTPPSPRTFARNSVARADADTTAPTDVSPAGGPTTGVMVGQPPARPPRRLRSPTPPRTLGLGPTLADGRVARNATAGGEVRVHEMQLQMGRRCWSHAI